MSPGALDVDWFAELRSAGPAVVARALGLESDSRGRAWSPCPICRATQRGGHDRRPPIGVVHQGAGWVCYACGAKGDAVALAAALTVGGVAPDRGRWREVRAECAARNLCDPEPGIAVVVQDRPRPVPAPPPAPTRPPLEEVAALWGAFGPVTEDAAAMAWFAGRKRPLDVHAVADLGVVRVLPRAYRQPSWARCNGLSWTEGGWRLVVPMYDATGVLVTVHARNVDPDRKPKGASPAGFEIGRTVMADALALGLLRGAMFGPWETVTDFVAGSRGVIPTASGEERAGVLIVEGVPDFLAAACSWSEAAETVPAVFGVIAGSWSEDIAARIPDGTCVVVATDADEAGDRYAAQIAATLEARCDLARWMPPEVGRG